MRILELNDKIKNNILENMLKRSPSSYREHEETVREIIANVRKDGDKAIFAYAEKFDGVSLNADNFRVSEEEIKEALSEVGDELLGVMKRSMENIRAFHEKQVRQSFFTTKEDGSILGQRITPIARVGVYVPGGKAVYPSSVLMNVVPALVAGVPEIVMTTPCGKDGKINANVLAAAHILGIKEIYKTGGAQAIAALAFGTESIAKADKIVGPGNIFVALAKREVYGHVSIDSIAG
ncbi:MAG: histidinol dehydrogenase, partial [Lachnospiraceae bacterium]|nr:histidinol dehydrogenase [Lachnospiraceae bacterium]